MRRGLRATGRVRLAGVFVLAGGLAGVPAAAQDGPALYAAHCTRCHDAGSPRIPSRTSIAQLAPERIVSALETGSMRSQGTTLNDGERRAIAVFVTGRPLGSVTAPVTAPRCSDEMTTRSSRGSGPAWNGWGAGAANNRYQPPEHARLTAPEVPRLRLRWAFGFPGDLIAAAQPTVFAGRVFVGSNSGRVFALDLRSGCAFWTFDADATVRTAITIAEAAGRQTAYFGDITATAYAVDASNGTLLWKRRVDEHPAARITGTPVFNAGRLYVPVSSLEEVAAADPKYPCCTFRGSVVALDAGSGAVIWKTHTIPVPAGPTGTSAGGVPRFG